MREFDSYDRGADFLDSFVTPSSADFARPSVVALDLDEFLARDFPTKEPLLDPWLRRQDLAMVYAKRGVGKTHFSLAVAFAVSSGGAFLKWKAPMPRRVLYIDGEMSASSLQERLRTLVKANADCQPPKGYLEIITPDAQEAPLPDLGTPNGQAIIEDQAAVADLIVIDNLSTLMYSAKENEGEGWMPMAHWALRMRRLGKAVLFVHHAGKSGSQRGSSRREDLLDTVIALRHPSDYAPKQGARFEVAFEKSRGLVGEACESIEAELTVHESGAGIWSFSEADGALFDRIIELEKLGMSVGEIAEDVGRSRSQVYRHLKHAKESGLTRKGA